MPNQANLSLPFDGLLDLGHLVLWQAFDSKRMALGLCPGRARGLGENSPALLGVGHQLAGMPPCFLVDTAMSKIDRARGSIAIFSRVAKVMFSLLEGL